jgi:hypothetical protein
MVKGTGPTLIEGHHPHPSSPIDGEEIRERLNLSPKYGEAVVGSVSIYRFKTPSYTLYGMSFRAH